MIAAVAFVEPMVMWSTGSCRGPNGAPRRRAHGPVGSGGYPDDLIAWITSCAQPKTRRAAGEHPDAPVFSVIVSLCNETASIRPLLDELRLALAQLGIAAEVSPVLVLEGAAALRHGFQRARGAWLAMLDGDGQNPPAERARVWARRDSADMITGARIGRKDSWLRRGMSRLANVVRRRLLRYGVADTGCSLKLFRREVAGSFLPIRTIYSFLPAFAVAPTTVFV